MPGSPILAAFHRGLKELGYVEGQNVAIEYHWSADEYDRLPGFAADLVRRGVSVIVASTSPAVPVAKAASSTTPIVFSMGGDPVALGYVASLSQPGGNLTGVTTLNVELGPKRLEVMHELVPAKSCRETCRRRRVASGSKSLFCVQVPNAISTRSSRIFPNSGSGRSWSERMRSSTAGANNSLHWPFATQYPRFINIAHLRRPAA